MKTYIIEYRINGGRWDWFPLIKARSAANAIIQAAQALRDISGNLEIRARAE